MKITNKIKKKTTASIVEFLASVDRATRGEIVDGALRVYGLSPKEAVDTSPKSKQSLLRSYISTALNDLTNKKDIKRDGEYYYLAKEEFIIVKEDMCQLQIKKLLECGAYTKDEIFSLLEGFFGTDATASTRDDYSLRSIAGNVLLDLVSSGEIEFTNGRYKIAKAQKTCFIDTPLPEKEFKPKLYKLLWSLGGKNFESFVANLLEKYYTMARQMVVYCDITGGSDDGGIDVALEIVDYLGFVEKIVVQTKCRDRAHVTEKEVREFYGAMNAQNATRGIYVTTTNFHPSAEYFIDSVGDLVGVDGDKLFELIKKTGYGIKKVDGGYVLDNEIFG